MAASASAHRPPPPPPALPLLPSLAPQYHHHLPLASLHPALAVSVASIAASSVAASASAAGPAPLSGLHFIFPRASRTLLCTPSFSGSRPPSSSQQQQQQQHATSLHPVRVQINAAINRGLRFEAVRWIAYRRNYLSITINVVFDIPLAALPAPLCSRRLTVDNHTFSVVLDPSSSSRSSAAAAAAAGEQKVVRVKFFAVTVVAEDEVNGRPVDLVQHTSKRDHGPRRKPVIARIRPTLGDGRLAAAPLVPSTHHHQPAQALDRPASATAEPPDYYYSPAVATATSSSSDDNGQPASSFDPVASAHYETTAEVVCFERIQFKRATANNGRKNTAQQMFRVVTILYAAVDESDCSDGGPDHQATNGNSNSNSGGIRYLEIQRVATGGIMVRGRSPGHYADRVGGGGLIQ
ncbi:hypothetical protein V1525DRAFT_456992 [Lipomyces kononenkoae]|uniref:Uncharacterized protein n=1 Tax=Lipomyces kononenkoae TaxID=34357 RepID=A0ACC3T0U3_LIPKO